MSLHSGYGLTQFLDLVTDDVPAFSLPSYLDSMSAASPSSDVRSSDTLPAAGQSEPARELSFFYRQLSLLAQKMLDAEHVSIWLVSPRHADLICSHSLGSGAQVGCVLGAEVYAHLKLELQEGLGHLSTEHAERRELWLKLCGAQSSGHLYLASILGPGGWQGLLCCHRREPITPQLLHLHAVLKQLAQLAERGLESLSQNEAEQRQLLHQQQLDRISFALRAKTGRAFFDELVSQFQRILGAREVWLAELESPPMQHWARVMTRIGQEQEYEFTRYPIDKLKAGTSSVAEGTCLQRDLCLPSPLPAAHTVYVHPLHDGKQQIIGHLVMTFERREPDMRMLHALLQLVGHRASAELERHRAEAELRLSAVAFETNEGIIITDPELVILRVNRAFTHITGLQPEAAVGKRLGKDIWPSQQAAEQLDDEGRWQGERERQDATGHSYPQWETWTPVRDEWGMVSHYVVCFEDMSERKAAARQIQNLAYYDDLTGLPNRRYLMEQVERSFQMARQHDMVGALLFIDLDHFKTINDSLGHAAGDWLLQQASARLRVLLRGADVLTRLGGDEFVMLLPALSSNPAQAELQATMMAEEIIAQISMPFDFNEHSLHIGASVGISLFPTREQTPADLLKQADTAMYQAKSAGRRICRLFDSEMQRQADRRLLIHNQLRNALRNNELVLFYQPQHMVSNNELIGLEALVRWNDARRGIVSPADFIPIAEETDLIIDIGRWVLLEGCHQYVRWHEAGIYVPQLSINVSARQFHHPDFVEHVHEVLAETGMEPSALNLEITESVVLGNTEDTIHKMTELKELGISFSIDDFGTGYSSLGYLKRLPVDELKIDRSFIQDIPHDTSNMAIVEAVMAMASHLNFTVTAEGVETRQQLEFLRKHKCAFYQGYLACKPLPVDAVERYLVRNNSLEPGCV